MVKLYMNNGQMVHVKWSNGNSLSLSLIITVVGVLVPVVTPGVVGVAVNLKLSVGS